MAWSFAGEDVRTPAVITGGDGPVNQRVAYGTADGRVHLRALATGADVGPPGGTLIADATLSDPGTAFGEGVTFASTSTDAAPGILFVVHNDGPGIEIARFREDSGMRVGSDVALADSLGCTVAGSPLFTPAAADGSRLLFFTITGRCMSGPSLVRIPVPADPAAALGTPARASVSGLIAGADPGLVVLGAHYVVAVPRTGGLDLRRADGDFAQGVDGSVELGEDPVALAAPETAPLGTPALLVLVHAGDGARVIRLDQGGDGALRQSSAVPVAGTPRGLAIGAAPQFPLAVATSAGITVLHSADLTAVGTAAGNFGPPSASGDLAFASGPSGPVAVRLTDAGVQALAGPAVAAFAPALARGYVAFGPVALLTTDTTAPAVAFPADAQGLASLALVASDDRGVVGASFALGAAVIGVATAPASGSRFAPGVRFETDASLARIPPGAYTLTASAIDLAGNKGSVKRAVRVPCGRSLRGGPKRDVLRGRAGRDCLYGRGGADRILARGGGADAVVCGPGRDVAKVDATDRVSADCERVRRPRR